MVSKSRAQRIAERIQQELSTLVIMDLSDPRLQGVTVTDVEVDRELAFATIYVSVYDDPGRETEVMAALEGAKGYIRKALAEEIPLRSFPQLRFRWDDTLQRGARIEELLEKLAQERGAEPPPDEEDDQ